VRSSLLLILISCQYGCHRREAVPVLAPIARITARLHAVPEFRIPGIEFVEVPENQLSTFANLITPSGPCMQEIKPRMHYLVADVVVEHTDGSKSNLMVRWTGHNPAAVSLDGSKYYYGGLDEFPDGATRIIQLLCEYDFNSRKSSSKPSEVEQEKSDTSAIPRDSR
jgi:hypothetical protein